MIDIATFLFLVTVFSIITSLFTEAFKKVTGDKISPNVIVAITSIFIGIAGGYIAFTLLDIDTFNKKNIIVWILLVPTNWLCAMLGYDKVMQTITQIIEHQKK